MRWILLLCLLPASASAQSLGLAARVGLSGPGIEISAKASDRVQIRISAAYLSISSDRRVTRGGTTYRIEGGLAAGSASILLDLFFTPKLRVSAGLSTFVTGGSVTVSPLSGAEIAGSSLSAAELGTVSLESAFPERPAPYLGIGYGNSIGRSRFSVLADFGVAYAGIPTFTSTAEGRLAATSSWAPVLADAFRSLRWHPILSVGIGVRIDGPSH